MATTAVDMEVVEVTPQLAEEWLQVNHVNRNVRQKLVASYRRDMEAGSRHGMDVGRWRFTGEPIKFSRTKYLIDGQHRLLAIAGSKKIKSIPMVVVRGLADEAQILMDQGQSRTVRDALIIQFGNLRNITAVASISRWMALTSMPGPHFTANLLRGKVSAAEAIETYQKFPEIDVAASRASTWQNTHKGSPTAMGYTWMAFQQVDPSANTEYWAGMDDLEFSYRKDPRKAAVNRLDYMFNVQELKTNLDSAVMMVSLFTRTWNAWRRGEDMERINVRSQSGIILPVKPI